MTLRAHDLHVAYAGRPNHALAGVSLAVEPARTLAVVGPSGAGKSTLLRALAGLVRTTRGRIELDGRVLDAQPPQARRIALVFAEPALLDHASVRANLALVLRDHARATQRIEEIAELLDIARHLDRRPPALSTGERQRVAIARALLSDPRALLLDEPLAALDPELRARVREELVHVRERFAGPMILVTHDHADAMAVADELAVLIDGRIEDFGEPQRVYDAPATARAAALLGVRPMNVLAGPLFGESEDELVGIRPERLHVGDGGIAVRVTRVERTGADAYVHADLRGTTLVLRVDAAAVPTIGATLAVGYDPRDLRRFDAATGRAR